MKQTLCPHPDGDRLTVETGLSDNVWVCLKCGAMKYENDKLNNEEIPDGYRQTELF